MTEQAGFTARVFQNQYLPLGGTVVDAVVTVSASASGAAASAAPPSAAQVIMVDCSGSMNSPPTKISEAKKATVTAIEALRDGVGFAVVSGRERAEMVYPRTVQLMPANQQTRASR